MNDVRDASGSVADIANRHSANDVSKISEKEIEEVIRFVVEDISDLSGEKEETE